jgi:hypothetical protein
MYCSYVGSGSSSTVLLTPQKNIIKITNDPFVNEFYEFIIKKEKPLGLPSVTKMCKHEIDSIAFDISCFHDYNTNDNTEAQEDELTSNAIDMLEECDYYSMPLYHWVSQKDYEHVSNWCHELKSQNKKRDENYRKLIAEDLANMKKCIPKNIIHDGSIDLLIEFAENSKRLISLDVHKGNLMTDNHNKLVFIDLFLGY